ncbi:MAG: ribonuclease P protein component [Bacteroidales bacterium]|nr:ribonuclease P protein component [Bacteroidales bacterium]
MYTFKKQERLCDKKTISSLYASNKKTLTYPLSVHWLLLPPDKQPCPLQVLIVAPKKKLHNAVDRNRTKRLMRECYRTRKQQLIDALEQQGQAMALGINYLHTAPPDFKHLQRSFDRLIDNLVEQVKQNGQNEQKEHKEQ